MKKVTDAQVLAALRKFDCRRALVCHELRVTSDHLRKIISRLRAKGYRVPGDPGQGGSNRGATYEPTPEQIKAECERIQAGWTPQEEAWHRGFGYRDFDGVEIRVVGDPQGGNAYLVEVEW